MIMKKVLFIFCLLFSIGRAKGNLTDTIPNGGFESWTFTGWNDSPTFWMTNNSQLVAALIVPDSDAYSGNLAMKVSYMNIFQPRAWCNFPLTAHPTNIGGYARNELGSGDSVVIVVRIFYNQVIVDSGYAALYGGFNPLYSPFIVPISQNSPFADSCEISITGGMTLETSITFDDLQFDFFQGITNHEKAGFTFYPNPCVNYVILRIDKPGFLPEQAEAINMLGQVKELQMDIDNESGDSYIVVVNTAILNKGMWLLKIRSKNESRTITLRKN